jgi:hypothetical protein
MPPPLPPVCDYMESVASARRYVSTSYFHKLVGSRAHVKEVLHLQPYQLLPQGSDLQEELLSYERSATQRERIRSHLMVAPPAADQAPSDASKPFSQRGSPLRW